MKATYIFLMILSLSSAALAQDPTPAPADMQPPAQPGMQADTRSDSSGIKVHPKTENGFTYMCGGIGSDESNYMKHAAKNYNLMSTFARQDGSYLADININISDKSGKTTLQTTCSGPIMLVKFPHAGTYTIRADAGGRTQTKTAQVQAKGGSHALDFVWPAK